MTDEVRAEADKLATEFKGAETQHRTALIAEGEEAAAAEGAFGAGDGEPAETRALLGRVRLPDYLNAAAAGIGLAGRPGRTGGGPRGADRRTGRRCGGPVADAGGTGARSAGGAGGAGVHHDRRLLRADHATGLSCNGFSGRGSWTRSGCEWIPSRLVSRNGR